MVPTTSTTIVLDIIRQHTCLCSPMSLGADTRHLPSICKHQTPQTIGSGNSPGGGVKKEADQLRLPSNGRGQGWQRARQTKNTREVVHGSPPTLHPTNALARLNVCLKTLPPAMLGASCASTSPGRRCGTRQVNNQSLDSPARGRAKVTLQPVKYSVVERRGCEDKH